MPARGSIKPRSAKFLPKEDVARLLSLPREAKATRDAHLLAALYYLALREGEAVRLRASHLSNVDRGSVYVPTLKRRRHACSRRCPSPCLSRGRWDRRRYPSVDEVLDLPLLEVPVLGGKEHLEELRRFSLGRDWVFPGGPTDARLSTRTVQRVFRLWAADAELPPEATAHSLRHSAISHLLESGRASPQLARDFARHSNLSVTDAYAHASMESWRKAGGAIDLPR